MLRKNLPELKINKQREVSEYRAAKAQKQEEAAGKIQASFRGHKARKSFFATEDGRAFADAQKARMLALRENQDGFLEDMVDGKTIADHHVIPDVVINAPSSSPETTPNTKKKKNKKKKKKLPEEEEEEEEVLEELGPDPDADLPPAKTLTEAYSRYVKGEKRRKQQDRILLQKLKKPLGKFVDWKGGLESTDVAMLAHTQNAHSLRLSEARKKSYGRKMINSARLIQHAWKAYVQKRDNAEADGVPLKSIRHFKRAKKYRDIVGTDIAEAGVAMARKANPSTARSRRVRAERRSYLHPSAGRTRATAIKLPAVSSKSYNWATETRAAASETKSQRVGKGARRSPTMSSLVKSSKTNQRKHPTHLAATALGGSITMSPVSVESLRIQRVIRAEAAATRTRLRKGWNDDPHYIPKHKSLPKMVEPPAAMASGRRPLPKVGSAVKIEVN